MSLALRSSMFRTTVRRKESAMSILLILTVLWGSWRVGRAAVESLQALPRSNDDMVFF